MLTTETADSRFAEQQRLEGELAVLSAHLNAATARWLRLVSEARRQGLAGGDDFACWLGFRCGISLREARGYLRVAEALEQLPVLRGAFERGELSFCKVRALTRVATPACEQGLLELAAALTASQLERALSVFRRLKAEQARDSHELEYLDYSGKKTARSFCERGCRQKTAPSSSTLSTPPANGYARDADWGRKRERTSRRCRPSRSGRSSWKRSSSSRPRRWRGPTARAPWQSPSRRGCSYMSTPAP